MNTTQLECFVNIANTLSFVKTAELMSLTQPAISRQLQSLEKELGARLINRTTRDVSLTPVGERFLPEAQDILRAIYHSQDWIASHSNVPQHYLRIGYGDPHAINCISRTLAILQSEEAAFSPRLMLDGTDANLSRLERGQLDLVVGMRDHTYENKDIVFREMRREQFACVVPEEHPLAAAAGESAAVTTDMLWPYPQVISLPPYMLRSYTVTSKVLLPVNDSLPNCSCSNNAEAYGLVLSGYGFCMIPTHLLMPHPALRFLTWEESPTASMGIYYRKGSPKDSPVIQSYLKAAAGVYSQLTNAPSSWRPQKTTLSGDL